jgi:hypothetical protein
MSAGEIGVGTGFSRSPLSAGRLKPAHTLMTSTSAIVTTNGT